MTSYMMSNFNVGINENSHFMFQELKNMEIVDHIQSWLDERGLN